MENWNLFNKNLKKTWLTFKVNWNKFVKQARYMWGEMKKQAPNWSSDVNEMTRKWRLSFYRSRKALRKTLPKWKSTFSTVNTSREALYDMLFEEKTEVGKLFESILIVIIIASVFVVILDSVDVLHRRLWWLLGILEWIFTIIFTVEYVLRLYSARRPFRYATSFFGIIDLVTLLPTYIGVIFTGAHTFLVLRILRVFRIFRLLKLVKLMRAGNTIVEALEASKPKIAVFLIFVMLMVTMMGSVLYIVEAGQDSGFTSIPTSIYWAIVTLTTVGYGDIAPSTWLGQTIAAAIMIIGYAVIAVPTGIVSAEFVNETKKANVDRVECPRCGKEEHEKGSRFCNRCAESLLSPTA